MLVLHLLNTQDIFSTLAAGLTLYALHHRWAATLVALV